MRRGACAAARRAALIGRLAPPPLAAPLRCLAAAHASSRRAGSGGASGAAPALAAAQRTAGDDGSSPSASLSFGAAALAAGALAGGVSLAQAAPPAGGAGQAAPPAPGSAVDAAGKPLPTFSRADVAAHNRRDTRIWVTFQARPATPQPSASRPQRCASHRATPHTACAFSHALRCPASLHAQEGVYDVTDFVAGHPGGAEKIMMAAGAAADAYWRLYPQHSRSAAAMQALAQRRVGTLDPKARASNVVCVSLHHALTR